MKLPRGLGRCLLVVVMAALLPGCWDEVNLQDVSYISAIGIDYKDEKIIMYAQMINFASVAKTEGPKSGTGDAWVGKGEGKSALMAYYDLMSAGYSMLNLEHLKTVIIHERALDRMDDVMDALNRHRAARYTSYIFGTTNPIDQILTTDNFFDQSPLYSILYMPKPHERQFTYIRPLQMQLAVQTFKEPTEMTFLPVINTTKTYWQKGKKQINTQLITGMFAFKDYRFHGYFSEKSVIGLRWLNPDFHRVFIEVGGNTDGVTVVIPNVKLKLIASTEGNEPRFSMRLAVQGSIVEMDGSMTKEEIEASVKETIRKELSSLYDLGLKKKVDFVGLEHHLYRYHNRYWSDHIKGKNWMPDKQSLTGIEVKFNLIDTGKFDLRTDT